MKKATPREEYELFYLELPQSDYFPTDIPIQDAYDDSDNDNQLRGLSDKQVSELADDQLGSKFQPQGNEPNLFTDTDSEPS